MAACTPPNRSGHPVTQLHRRLTAERENQNPLRVRPLGDTPGHRLHQRGRFSGARSGEHQQRPRVVVNHRTLPCVQDRWINGARRGAHQPVGARAADAVPGGKWRSSRGSPVLGDVRRCTGGECGWCVRVQGRVGTGCGYGGTAASTAPRRRYASRHRGGSRSACCPGASPVRSSDHPRDHGMADAVRYEPRRSRPTAPAAYRGAVCGRGLPGRPATPPSAEWTPRGSAPVLAVRDRAAACRPRAPPATTGRCRRRAP